MKTNKNPPTSNNILAFKEGDKVELKNEFKSYSTDLKTIVGTVLVVVDCKLRDLNDMMVEVLYLKPTGEDLTIVKNPYLARHFKLKEDEPDK